ncbi:D-alanyl-D-alanine carboxypeptidase family protein [Rubritalea tangerina]|uniref:D-alanyl-D-alanine carboxypeptidase family protein n=1 Tax=Rubritalea tangerina TaxID=430798 RepID=A0ABW4ZAJ9_9BACT
MTRRLFHICVFQTLISFLLAGALQAAPAPSIGAKRAIVIDNKTGRILYQKNAHEKCAVASTQKLLTALCVLDAGSTRDRVTIQKTDTYCEPTKLYLRPGDSYTRHDLLKALVVKSGNDVARALARDVSGSQVNFARYMNQKARQMGMQNSNFINPNGLTEKGQYSTAYDVAIMARNAYSRPAIREMMKTKGYYFQYANGSKKYLKNTNKLLTSVPYCDGMKTGTTIASGRCLVTSGTYRGRTAIVVCLGATSKTIWSDSEKLLRWALES